MTVARKAPSGARRGIRIVCMAVFGVVAVHASWAQTFGTDSIREAFPTPQALYPGDVRKQLEILDPELAAVLPLQLQRDVPGLVPMTAEGYIAERELTFDAIARSADFWTTLRAAISTGYNLTYRIHERVEYERNAPPEDRSFNAASYLADHMTNLRPVEIQQYRYVRSEREAEILAETLQARRRADDLLSRRLQQ